MMTAVAWLCLTCPVEPPAVLAEHPAVFPAIERLAKREEVWATWDTSPYDGSTTLQGRCRIWRERYQRMKGWPHCYEIQRFNCLDARFCQQQAETAEQWIRWQEGQMSLDLTNLDRYERRQAIVEAKRRQDAWNKLNHAQWDDLAVVYQREYLNEIRELIGYEAFVQGRMPDPIPH